MGEAEILGIIFGTILFVLMVFAFLNNSMGESRIIKQVQEFEPTLDKLEFEIQSLVKELSKYIYSCKKCQNNIFYVTDTRDDRLQYTCFRCNKNYELKTQNAFYKINCISKIHLKWNELYNLIKESNIYKDLCLYMQGSYEFETDTAPKSTYSYRSYNFFYNKRKIKYITHRYRSSKKTFSLYINTHRAFEFKSDGSMMDKIEEKKRRAKMGKLNPNRPALTKTLEKEWNYKSITRGKKSLIIKDWAKNTNQKCPDGRKCGGVRFKELSNSNIAYGHILSQDFTKTFPHLHNQVHHPDNLYLTCKSCNSSLGGNNADKELINRIKNESGTVGDWLRNYINEISSSELKK